MRDLAVLVALLSLAGLALWRPWLGVLGLAFFGYLQPHSYVDADSFMRHFPVYRTLFAASLLGALLTRDRQLAPKDWRVWVLLSFWIALAVTTWFSVFPFIAWPKFIEVSGTLASTCLILVLINTREKLFLLLATIALAFALVSFKGGYWALLHGFSDRVYGPPGSQYGDNNHFAVAAVMTIPLLVLWFRESTSRRLKAVLAAAMVLTISRATAEPSPVNFFRGTAPAISGSWRSVVSMAKM